MVGVMTRREGLWKLDTMIGGAPAATGYCGIGENGLLRPWRRWQRDEIAIFNTLSPEDVPAPYYVLIIGV
jgi:hypothetical protein